MYIMGAQVMQGSWNKTCIMVMFMLFEKRRSWNETCIMVMFMLFEKKRKKLWEVMGHEPMTFNMLTRYPIAPLRPAATEALTIESHSCAK